MEKQNYIYLDEKAKEDIHRLFEYEDLFDRIRIKLEYKIVFHLLKLHFEETNKTSSVKVGTSRTRNGDVKFDGICYLLPEKDTVNYMYSLLLLIQSGNTIVTLNISMLDYMFLDTEIEVKPCKNSGEFEDSVANLIKMCSTTKKIEDIFKEYSRYYKATKKRLMNEENN